MTRRSRTTWSWIYRRNYTQRWTLSANTTSIGLTTLARSTGSCRLARLICGHDWTRPHGMNLLFQHTRCACCYCLIPTRSFLTTRCARWSRFPRKIYRCTSFLLLSASCCSNSHKSIVLVWMIDYHWIWITSRTWWGIGSLSLSLSTPGRQIAPKSRTRSKMIAGSPSRPVLWRLWSLGGELNTRTWSLRPPSCCRHVLSRTLSRSSTGLSTWSSGTSLSVMKTTSVCSSTLREPSSRHLSVK